jgi:hypothetical protein
MGPTVRKCHPFGNERVFIQKLAHQFQRSMLVPLRLGQHIEDLAFGADARQR